MPWKTGPGAANLTDSAAQRGGSHSGSSRGTPQGITVIDAPSILEDGSPIAVVIQVARSLTGKAPRKSDGELATWLAEKHEITDHADMVGLSDSSFLDLQQAPGMSLILFDALSDIRRGTPLPRTGRRRLLSQQLESQPVVAEEAAGASPSRVCEVEIRDVAGGNGAQIGIIMMSNYQRRNVLNHQMCADMMTCCNECLAAGVRAVILRAEPGAQVWSAGHDIREFKRIDGSDLETGETSFQDPLSRDDPFVRLLATMRNLEIPIIGCIEGSVWGSASDVAATCDFLIGTPDVTFAITPAKVGIPYHASGMTHFIQVMPLHVVKWLFMSGCPLTAEEASRYGFLNCIVPAEKLSEKAEEMATTLALRAPLVVSLLKKQLSALISQPSLPAEVFEELHFMRNHCWASNDMAEGIKSFFERRPPVFTGT